MSLPETWSQMKFIDTLEKPLYPQGFPWGRSRQRWFAVVPPGTSVSILWVSAPLCLVTHTQNWTGPPDSYGSSCLASYTVRSFYLVGLLILFDSTVALNPWSIWKPSYLFLPLPVFLPFKMGYQAHCSLVPRHLKSCSYHSVVTTDAVYSISAFTNIVCECVYVT